jgi:hypothetical protein
MSELPQFREDGNRPRMRVSKPLLTTVLSPLRACVSNLQRHFWYVSGLEMQAGDGLVLNHRTVKTYRRDRHQYTRH